MQPETRLTEATGILWKLTDVEPHGNRHLPVPLPQALEGRTDMTNADNVKVTFINPTNSADTMDVTVSPQATPKWLIEQLVKNGFIPPADRAGQYKLCNAESGVQLLDNVGLAAAGVTSGTNLKIDDTVTGALWVR